MNLKLGVVLAVIATVLAIVVVALLAREQSFPPDAQAALNEYIQYRYPPSHAPAVRQVVRASLPWNFSAEMSGATFGDGVFFRTTHDYRAQPVVNLPGSPSVTPSWGSVGFDDRPVLPFPPTDVWCVLLQDEIPSSATVVYIAIHQDLYIADWVLHEPAGGSKEITDALSKIGCDLKLGERLGWHKSHRDSASDGTGLSGVSSQSASDLF